MLMDTIREIARFMGLGRDIVPDEMGTMRARHALQGCGIDLSWGVSQPEPDHLVCCPAVPYTGGA